MASAVPMSRSRGSLSGLALFLLGAWGCLAPFVGPYFHLGFQPGDAWSFDAGRLYLVIAPGAVAALCGLIVMATRSRWLAGISGFIAALAGLWFVLGRTAMLFIGTTTAPYVRSLVRPIAQSPRGVILTEVLLFTGVGVLIVFFGALASGRVSIGAYRDFVRAGDAGGGLADVGLSASPSYTPYQSPTVSTFIPGEDPIVGGQVKFPSQYPGASTLTPGQVTYSPGQTKYPPTQEQQTNPLTAPTQEQKSPGQ